MIQINTKSHYRKDVLDEIALINEKFPEPQCYLVALLLTSKFGGRILYNSDHCLTVIDFVMYDKSGIVPLDTIEPNLFLDLEEFGIDIKKSLIEALIYKHKDLC